MFKKGYGDRVEHEELSVPGAERNSRLLPYLRMLAVLHCYPTYLAATEHYYTIEGIDITAALIQVTSCQVGWVQSFR